MAIPKLNDYALPTADELPQNKVTWQVEPQRAALLIHDMQQYFLNFWGEDSALIKQVVENIANLRRYCKQQGIPVFYTAQPNQQSDEDRALLNDMWGPGLNKHPEQQAVTAALAPDEDDTVLVKWRYSAFHRSPLQEILQESGRDQLIICGVYAHIGCLTTAIDAFMRNIQPFMVADGLADFSRDEHLMALRYTAGRCGRVVTTGSLLPAAGIASIDALRQQILPLLDEDSEDMGNDENLIDYGLDSVRIMELATRWRKIRSDIDFIALARNPTIDSWWALLSEEKA
ncbi:isochorismatase [Serratia marcescens]|jgi:bifunctional isochorismate lyase/aryl carrier protein|uniref:isochorismatase n=1 Tax=Serratia marcescens TaxID=615 RepID=UPI000D73C4E0|nr:isochorismatase [Serratia marcescens]AWO77370.1 isochorismatase [Serratia marcescens]MBN5291338.1 isochorismatase [Serratia marcescens]MDW7736473.1 isochorismatase [Serratia marcescens]CAI1963274.1 Isochorismatase [Serratia marcescens]HCD2061714.1 isochorismatase [Serratia marcescens]